MHTAVLSSAANPWDSPSGQEGCTGMPCLGKYKIQKWDTKGKEWPQNSMTADSQLIPSQATLYRCFQPLSWITGASSRPLEHQPQDQLFLICDSSWQFSYWNIQQICSSLAFLPFLALKTCTLHISSQWDIPGIPQMKLFNLWSPLSSSSVSPVLLYHFRVKLVLL